MHVHGRGVNSKLKQSLTLRSDTCKLTEAFKNIITSNVKNNWSLIKGINDLDKHVLTEKSQHTEQSVSHRHIQD